MERLRLRAGVDLVHIPRLVALLANVALLRRAFQPVELRDPRPEHLAGIFAAKEACFKALGCAPCWLAVTVDAAHDRPRLALSPEITPPGLLSLDLSVSHEGEYAVAVVVMLIHEDGSDGEHDRRDRAR